MPILVMLSPAPVLEAPGGDVVLDARFVEGMGLHCQLWPGPVYCVLWRGAAAIPDGIRFSPRRLGFEMILLDRGAGVPESLLDEAALVYCAADDLRHLHLAEAMRTRIGRLVYTLEQPLADRLANSRDARWPLRRQAGAVVYNLRREMTLRSALRGANGVHLNGLATAAAYGRLNPRTLTYLDNRIRQPMLARSAEQAARAERLMEGAPLALAAMGALEPGSGMEDLVPVAHMLANIGVAFRLEIHGQGPLAESMLRGIAVLGLEDRVRLAPPAGFEGHLLPALRREADLMLMPRRLPEGPGPYIEAMGCGLPVAGYASAGWRRLAVASGAGWVTAARPSALARRVARLAGDRGALVVASERARAFAGETTFEQVFAARMIHLREVAGLE
jgi:colanic acid/amylovoran biosynthesis glycosyltransferase